MATSASMPACERGERVLEARDPRDIGARRTEHHAAGEMDARDLVDRHLVLFVGVALGEPSNPS